MILRNGCRYYSTGQTARSVCACPVGSRVPFALAMLAKQTPRPRRKASLSAFADTLAAGQVLT